MVGHPTGTENERQMVRTRRQFLLVLSLAAIAFSTGRWGSQATASGPEADEALDLARRLSTAYQRLAEQVGPAVVQVKSYRQGTRGRRSVQDGSGVVVHLTESWSPTTTSYGARIPTRWSSPTADSSTRPSSVLTRTPTLPS